MPNETLMVLVLDEILELAASYGNSHHMSIPPQVGDTDMLFSELLRRFKNSLDENKRLNEEIEDLQLTIENMDEMIRNYQQL